MANNQGEGNVELWATYFDVPPGGSPRLDANDPGRCPDLDAGTTHAL